jgi:hypothetical protein
MRFLISLVRFLKDKFFENIILQYAYKIIYFSIKNLILLIQKLFLILQNKILQNKFIQKNYKKIKNKYILLKLFIFSKNDYFFKNANLNKVSFFPEESKLVRIIELLFGKIKILFKDISFLYKQFNKKNFYYNNFILKQKKFTD